MIPISLPRCGGALCDPEGGKTEGVRRHIAQQLRFRKGEVSKEAELHRAEALASAAGQELQLQMRLSELQAKYEKLRDEGRLPPDVG